MYLFDPRVGIATLGIVLLGTVIGGCSVFGIRTVDEAPYSVLDKDGQFELREYAQLLLAETTVDAGFDEAGSIAFKRLFGYISGANTTQTKIDMTAPVIADPATATGRTIKMTAPVIAEPDSDGWRYAFVLPEKFTTETAPAPTNKDVELVEVPSKRVAAISFSGSWEEQTLRAKATELLDWLDARGYQTVSLPRSAGYDPPWTLPFLRRNEVLIDIL